jgi:hypothetical protein
MMADPNQTIVADEENNESGDECPRSIHVDDVAYYRFVTIAAVVLIIALQLLKQWRERQGGKCWPPVVIWPVDLIGQRRHRFPYVAAFNVSAWTLLTVIMGDSPLKLETSIAPISSLLKLCTCVVLAIIFYPVFASISSNDVIGFALGGAYVWMLTIVHALTNYPNPCPNGVISSETYDAFQFVPCLFWLLYLCIYFPYRIIQILRKRNNPQKPHAMVAFHREYVHRLLNYPDQSPVPFMTSYGRKGSLLEKASRLFFSKVYAPVKGFRYPVTMLTAASVSMTLVWTLAIQLLQIYQMVGLLGRAVILGFLGPKVQQYMVNSTLVQQTIEASPLFTLLSSGGAA